MFALAGRPDEICGMPAAATVAFAANTYKQNQIFPPPSNPEASSNKNSSAHSDLYCAGLFNINEAAFCACRQHCELAHVACAVCSMQLAP